MRLIRFVDSSGRTRWGSPVDGGLARPLRGSPFEALSLDPQPVKVDRRLAPIEPPNILAIGRNYREHAREMSAADDLAEPLVFLKATTSIIGPGEEIVLPRQAPDEVDYEAELAVVIGRRTRRVTEDAALEYVLGFTCANDISARDCQKRRDKQWARGKSFDSFCPVGPELVTPDEVELPRARVRSLLNGKVMQEAPVSDMIFSVPYLVSYLSHQFTLLPGTVILTGTPAGVGAARIPPIFLKSDDLIEVEIDGIGRLSNRVTTE
jgi:2-keto-4-pentenoate hydratase/2-oxohepta-3-ene-1,7-dioic acid hydratase in catechol pathway